jgi:hypothetical protein
MEKLKEKLVVMANESKDDDSELEIELEEDV